MVKTEAEKRHRHKMRLLQRREKRKRRAAKRKENQPSKFSTSNEETGDRKSLWQKLNPFK